MTQDTATLEQESKQDAVGHSGGAASHEGDQVSRLIVWLLVSGFVMMFLASLLMWVRIGPTMFVDLATAIRNCF